MTPNHLELKSADGTKLNLEALYQIAPSCFTEVKDEKTGELRHVVNFTTLRQLLGDDAVEDAQEMYQFTWPGKQEARREAARPVTDTLRPCPEESVDWDTTQNLYIEGDNLAVLKLLQKGYMGKVKMIYIDPPYNTGNDFVYHDDFAVSQKEMDLFSGDVDEEGNRYRKNTDSNGRFHSDWCSMMYSRLIACRALLREDGLILISIGDAEIDNLKKLGTEVFGSANFIAQLNIITGANQSGDGVLIQKNVEYCLVFAKNISCTTIIRVDETEKSWRNLNDAPSPFETRLDMGYTIYYHPESKDMILEFDYDKTKVTTNDATKVYTDIAKHIEDGYVPVRPGMRNGKLHRWRWGSETFNQRKDEIQMFQVNGRFVPKFLQAGYNAPKNTMNFTGGANDLKKLFGDQIPFDYPKGLSFIKYLCSFSLDKDDVVLDYFSGSATTAHAVMQLNAEDNGNRHFICVQLPEETPEESEARRAGFINIPEIAKERIRRAAKSIKEDAGILASNSDTGFRVFKIADSNFNNVEFTPKEFTQDLLSGLESNIKEGRTDLDLLFGAMLDWGVQLSLPMSKETVDSCDIYTVNEGDLVACFSENVTENVVSAMASKMPLRVLFRDSCFAEDKAKINVFELFKQKLDWGEDEAIKNIRVI